MCLLRKCIFGVFSMLFTISALGADCVHVYNTPDWPPESPSADPEITLSWSTPSDNEPIYTGVNTSVTLRINTKFKPNLSTQGWRVRVLNASDAYTWTASGKESVVNTYDSYRPSFDTAGIKGVGVILTRIYDVECTAQRYCTKCSHIDKLAPIIIAAGGTSNMITSRIYAIEVRDLLVSSVEEFQDRTTPIANRVAYITARKKNDEDAKVVVTAIPYPSVPADKLPTGWSLTGGDSPEGPGESPKFIRIIKKNIAKITTVSASCLGSPSKSAVVYVVGVDIRGNGYPQATSRVRVMAGTKMQLSAVIVPSSSAYTMGDLRWLIPEKKIKNWNATMAKMTINKIVNDDLIKSTINFFWIDEGVKNVQVACYVAGLAVTDSAGFEALKPELTASIETVDSSFIGDIGGYGIHCASPTKNGIRFAIDDNDLKEPVGHTGGSVAWIQILNNDRTWINPDGTPKIIETKADGWKSDALVDGFYYAKNNYSTSDDPWHGLGSQLQYVKLIIDCNYKMYLMYKPSGSGSTYVPLAKHDWSWSVTVNKDDNNVWTKENDNPPTGSIMTPTSSYPEWGN